jgi:hypothetical protein
MRCCTTMSRNRRLRPNVTAIRHPGVKSAREFRIGLSAAQLRRRLRAHAEAQLYDESGVPPEGVAIYTLADPRDIRDVRYVGQTSAPRRRFRQHLNYARLWLPDELPWWVKQPTLRPLYTWIRELYRDEWRLPVMVVAAWAASVAEARVTERARIFEYLSHRRPLLNVETQNLRGQVLLL